MTCFRISKSGRQHGWGSDRYKWVSGLTADERLAVRQGKVVLITAGVRQHGGNPRYRKVMFFAGRYIPRVPAATEMP